MPHDILEIYSYKDEETNLTIKFELEAKDPQLIKKKKALRNMAKTFIADIDTELAQVERQVK